MGSTAVNKDGKPPGNDGLTKEFFVCFFGEVAPLLIQSLNYSFTVGELSTSQKQAVITLIQKKGRDKRLVKNWRPFSLMNIDTKIASKVMALGMKKVLPNIINYDQTAYVKNRYIGKLIRVIDDIFYHAQQENLDGILFNADMEKHLIHWNITLSSQPLLDLDLARNLFSGSRPFCGMAVVVL